LLPDGDTSLLSRDIGMDRQRGCSGSVTGVTPDTVGSALSVYSVQILCFWGLLDHQIGHSTIVRNRYIVTLSVGAAVLGTLLTALGPVPGHATPQVSRVDPAPMIVLAAVEERDDAAPDFSPDAVRLSALVSRIQDVLAELGIYAGPTDGTMSPATERAIRIYESQVDLAVTGRPTKELLDHLETVGRANKLLVRLENTRDKKREAARNMLLSSSIANRLKTGESAAADPLRDPSGCFSTPSPTCLLEEGFQSAKAIGDTKFRDWALGDIAIALATAGLVNEVYRTVGLIEDPRLVVAALRDAAIAWATNGQAEPAREVISGMPEPMFSAEILGAIATAKAREGDKTGLGQVLGELLAIASAGNDLAATLALLTDLAPKLHVAGAADAADHLLRVALDTAHDAKIRGTERDRALGQISAVHATLGQTKRARELMAEISTPAMRRPVLLALTENSAQSRSAPPAMEDAADVVDARYRVVALTYVAIAQARAGNIEGAEQSLKQARSDTEEIDARFTYAKAFAVSRIAAALAEMRGYQDAATAAKKIEDGGLRAQSLWHLASVQARDGSTDAEETRSLAWAAAESITSDLDRSWTLSRLALSSADRGEGDLARTAFDAALDVAAEIENSFARASALARLATTLVALERQPSGR